MSKKENYKYKFSVIIPVYKVEEYIEETLQSVINQTIGFEENIQIVIVNDGSPDNSEKICKKYTKLYPKNIKYIYQENAGVSAARNNGIKYATGKYINFLDSDDKWDKNVFEKVWKMFEENADLNVIGVRQKRFESANGYTQLDYKFDKDKVVDLNVDYDHIQLSVTSGFVRSSAIGDVRFDTRIKYSEDANFLNEILLKSMKLGIIASSRHLYRKRASENSAVQVKNSKDDWYLITPTLSYKHGYELSKEKLGYIHPYFQYYVGYDYQWRMAEEIPSTISDETKKEYIKITKELFKETDDKIILEQRKIDDNLKLEYLKFKYGKEFIKKLKFNDETSTLTYNELPVFDLEKGKYIQINIIDVENGKIRIRGMVNLNLPTSKYKLNYVINNKKSKEVELVDTEISPKKLFNEIYNYNKGFDIEVDLKNLKYLHFEIEYEGNKVQVKFNDNVHSKISSKSRIYYIKDKHIFSYLKRGITVKKSTLKNRIYFGLRNLKYNLQNKKIKVIIMRTLAKLLKSLKRKEIWIVSDRTISANDNGYAFFKYMMDIKDKKVKTYFLIDEKSSDFNKVKETGPVLNYNSFKHKLYYLIADKIVSSQADPWVFNPLGKSSIYYKDLFDYKFVFLQHGIIKDDLSVWLNKYEKDLKIFVTTMQREYNSIIEGNYGFDGKVVKLTGLPRYDLLEDKNEKMIAILPTWRRKIAGRIDPITGVRVYNNNFKDSEYYNYYNNLINDKRLLKTFKKYNYKGLFVVHPSHYANAGDFEGNEFVKVETEMANYSEIFSKSSLLISDYSSVPFDFAYLKKPCIYTQFDRENFFNTHIYTSGYFSYEKDGFGPVINEYEKLVDEIIKYIEKDCKIEKKYLDRIEKSYKYTDRKNSERVYKEIKKL